MQASVMMSESVLGNQLSLNPRRPAAKHTICTRVHKSVFSLASILGFWSAWKRRRVLSTSSTEYSCARTSEAFGSSSGVPGMRRKDASSCHVKSLRQGFARGLGCCPCQRVMASRRQVRLSIDEGVNPAKEKPAEGKPGRG